MIEPVTPSDDLEYYLSGPHWLDAVTPPLENHLEQLRTSMKALLALSGAEVAGKTTETDFPRAASVAPSQAPIPQAIPATAQRPTAVWKWVALGVAAITVLGTVALVITFTWLRPHLPTAVVTSSVSPSPQSSVAVQQIAKIETQPPLSVAPPSAPSVLTTEEAERLVRQFNRDMERGDLNATMSYLDDTVDYYSFGPKDKIFITEQVRQYFAAVSVRAFVVGDVKVQPGPKPTVATVIFETRYSVRDISGTLNTGRTRTEWDVVRKSDDLKVVRTNWITYPDASPSR